MPDISYLGAAIAGLLSFFSPCILPMVPFYLAYMCGLSVTELRSAEGIAPRAQRQLIGSAIVFALGVTTIFMLLGLGSTALGRVFADYRQPLSYLAAAILLLFGLHFLGAVRTPLLQREIRTAYKVRP